jgi:hypothetical protein
MKDARPPLDRSLDRLEQWVERHDYRGYEPFDGLTSFLYPLTFRNRLACQLLQQGIRRFPLNLRPWLGVRPLDSTKGRGYMAWGYLQRYQLDQGEDYRAKAFACLDWLDRHRSPLYPFHSWGNQFFYASRSGFIDKDESTIVWTGLIGQAFLDAYAMFQDPRHRTIIESIGEWIMALPRLSTPHGICLSYVMPRQSSIHNSNMIGAAFLAGAGQVLGRRDYLETAHQAMAYSCSRQLADGGWYYGEDPMFHWIDAFHTGYDLDSLWRYGRSSGDASFDRELRKGFELFRASFFEPTGRVKYYRDKAGPIDIQCASQAIDTLVLFAELYPEGIAAARKTAGWTIEHMQGGDGHFYFRRYPLGIANKAPMIHWGQATMYKALAHLRLHGD